MHPNKQSDVSWLHGEGDPGKQPMTSLHSDTAESLSLFQEGIKSRKAPTQNYSDCVCPNNGLPFTLNLSEPGLIPHPVPCVHETWYFHAMTPDIFRLLCKAGMPQSWGVISVIALCGHLPLSSYSLERENQCKWSFIGYTPDSFHGREKDSTDL